MKPRRRWSCWIGWHPRRWYVMGWLGPNVRGCRDCTWQQWSLYAMGAWPRRWAVQWFNGPRPDFEALEEVDDEGFC